MYLPREPKRRNRQGIDAGLGVANQRFLCLLWQPRLYLRRSYLFFYFVVVPVGLLESTLYISLVRPSSVGQLVRFS